MSVFEQAHPKIGHKSYPIRDSIFPQRHFQNPTKDIFLAELGTIIANRSGIDPRFERDKQ